MTEKLRPLWGREGVSTKSSKLWEGMGSRGVKWLTQITNLWVVGLALDPETHGLTSYFLIPAITVGIPQERSRGSQWSKHDHAWTYSCPSYLLALHSGVGRVHRRGRGRSRWGSVRLINELKHPQEVQFHRCCIWNLWPRTGLFIWTELGFRSPPVSASYIISFSHADCYPLSQTQGTRGFVIWLLQALITACVCWSPDVKQINQ